MRHRTKLALIALSLGVLCVPALGRAYELSGGGGKLGYTSPEDFGGTMMVGGHLEFEQAGSRVHLLPNVMYWHVNETSDINPNLDVYYHFRREGRGSPYLGGGVGLNVRRSDFSDRRGTDMAANVIGGWRFQPANGANNYFVEGRLTASEVSQAALMAGITFKTH